MSFAVSGMNCYLSGAMTGVEHFNAPEFARGRAILHEAGAREIFDPTQKWFHTSKEKEYTHEQWMAIDLRELLRRGSTEGSMFYAVLVQLPGWEESEGARVEAVVAEACGMTVISIDEVTA